MLAKIGKVFHGGKMSVQHAQLVNTRTKTNITANVKVVLRVVVVLNPQLVQQQQTELVQLADWDNIKIPIHIPVHRAKVVQVVVIPIKTDKPVAKPVPMAGITTKMHELHTLIVKPVQKDGMLHLNQKPIVVIVPVVGTNLKMWQLLIHPLFVNPVEKESMPYLKVQPRVFGVPLVFTNL